MNSCYLILIRKVLSSNLLLCFTVRHDNIHTLILWEKDAALCWQFRSVSLTWTSRGQQTPTWPFRAVFWDPLQILYLPSIYGFTFFFLKCDKAQLITSVRISGELIVQSVWFHLTKQGFDLQIYIYNENLSSSQWNWFHWTKNHLIYINYIIFSN